MGRPMWLRLFPALHVPPSMQGERSDATEFRRGSTAMQQQKGFSESGLERLISIAGTPKRLIVTPVGLA